MKHPGHTYGGFIPAISERGMTVCMGACGPILSCKAFNVVVSRGPGHSSSPWYGKRLGVILGDRSLLRTGS
jgi:hypothetical protein